MNDIAALKVSIFTLTDNMLISCNKSQILPAAKHNHNYLPYRFCVHNPEYPKMLVFLNYYK